MTLKKPPSEGENCSRDIESQIYVRSSKSQESCRSESQTSSHSSTNVEICRICHCEGDGEGSLIAPCYCSGSLRYVHQACLQQWIKSSNIRCCELCKFQFIMQTKTKPLMKWEPLEMTGFERRKLLCAVIFHAIALTCVVWSLYVLIHRTAEEIHYGLLEWPFWTKLVVVAIGFTGGVVFMYIQCKAYLQICQRWKAFNRVIYVQNAPEKQPLHTPLQLTIPSMSAEVCSGSSQSKTRNYHENGNYKDETSIDLKGVRNLHIFLNDESRVCLQNEQYKDEVNSSLEAVTVAPNSNQRNDDVSTSWHIKIGKGSGVEQSSTPSQRCQEAESKFITNEHTEAKKSSRDETDAKNDSVLKLQIKKAEIVIKFGQNSNGELTCEESQHGESRQDRSVNIKIDDKESNPIVIGVVQTESVKKDPVQIRFDFSQNEDEKLEDSSSKLLQPYAGYNSNSETDSGSYSPLLSKVEN